MNPVVIAVAITGSVPRKRDNPAVPITPSEQIESTHEAYAAGASLVHIHVRNDDESPSSDPERFAAVQAGIVKHCPGIVVQFSTGGRGRDPQARGAFVGRVEGEQRQAVDHRRERHGRLGAQCVPQRHRPMRREVQNQAL